MQYACGKTGRWLSKDPIGINGGLNQYVFCGNNPVMFGDPEGTKWWYVDYWAECSLDGSWVNKSFSCVMGTFAAAIPDVLTIDLRFSFAKRGGLEGGVGFIINLHDCSVSRYDTGGFGGGLQRPAAALTLGLGWNSDVLDPVNTDFSGNFTELSGNKGYHAGSVYFDEQWLGFSYGVTAPKGVGGMVSFVEYDVKEPYGATDNKDSAGFIDKYNE